MKQTRSKERANSLSELVVAIAEGEFQIIPTFSKNKEKSVAEFINSLANTTFNERPLGILKGKASFSLKDDFKMTDEELLGL